MINNDPSLIRLLDNFGIKFRNHINEIMVSYENSFRNEVT